MEKVGLGRYTIEVNVGASLTEEDWDNIASAECTLRRPNNEKSPMSVTKKEYPLLAIKLEVEEEGEYAFSIRIDFKDGDWFTSTEASRFRATDGF